jgi:hypothetical protein
VDETAAPSPDKKVWQTTPSVQPTIPTHEHLAIGVFIEIIDYFGFVLPKMLKSTLA